MTRIQKLHLDLMRESSSNVFDGKKVARWLEGHTKSWIGAMMVQDSGPGITLRDLPRFNNVSTLYLSVPDEASAEEIMRVARDSWQADEAGVLSPDQVERFLGGHVEGVVRIWWD